MIHRAHFYLCPLQRSEAPLDNHKAIVAPRRILEADGVVVGRQLQPELPSPKSSLTFFTVSTSVVLQGKTRLRTGTPSLVTGSATFACGSHTTRCSVRTCEAQALHLHPRPQAPPKTSQSQHLQTQGQTEARWQHPAPVEPGTQLTRADNHEIIVAPLLAAHALKKFPGTRSAERILKMYASLPLAECSKLIDLLVYDR